MNFFLSNILIQGIAVVDLGLGGRSDRARAKTPQQDNQEKYTKYQLQPAPPWEI